MDRHVFYDNVCWDGLERAIVRANITYATIERDFGMVRGQLRMTIKEKRSCSISTLVKLAAYFRCGVNELVQFRDIEVKERYKEPYYRIHDPVDGGISYGPMRDLFFNFYGDQWRVKLNEFFSSVETFDKTDRMLEAIRNNEGFRNYNDGRRTDNPRRSPGGFTQDIRAKLRNDRNVNLGTLYLICRALGCTPDYIVDYK